jgi:hypothetical protein
MKLKRFIVILCAFITNYSKKKLTDKMSSYQGFFFSKSFQAFIQGKFQVVSTCLRHFIQNYCVNLHHARNDPYP